MNTRALHDTALHARRIVRVYQTLAKNGEHLLSPLLEGKPPRQWAHYPDDDAIDGRHRFQWYYHSHSPADRPDSSEHGHIHLFARTDAKRTPLDAEAESAFLKRLGSEDSESKTRHLLAIGLSPVGIPISLFTVNRWVTGDQLLSATGSLRLLQSLSLDTGHRLIDRLIGSLIYLYRPQLKALFRKRDTCLFARARSGPSTLDDESLELLSETRVDLDRAVSSARHKASAF
ncbi:MAG: DUF6969 family protein [Steroidobacteraceae bacterium]